MKAVLTSLLAGLVFGVGLCVSGMADPKNVLAFLDVAGNWSPNLALVMLGAIGVHAVWLGRDARARGALGSSLPAPGKPRIDAALLSGAALFGIGWGLSGYCPGPSVVALGSGALGSGVFLAAAVAGVAFCRALTTRGAAREGRSPPATVS